MAESIKFREFSPSDLAPKKELFELCFPETRGVAAFGASYHDWKFTAAPSDPPSQQFLAEEGGRTIGYYAGLPLEYKIDGQKARVALVVDVMVHPQHQGKGIFRKLGIYGLASMKERGFDITTGYPIRPQVMPGHLKAGWKVAFPLPMYISLLDSRSLLASKGWPRLHWIVNPFVWLQACLFDLLLARIGPGYEIELKNSAEAAVSEEFQVFQQRWLQGQGIAWTRGRREWTWRLSRPLAEYHSVLLRDAKGGLAGHAVVSPTVLKGVSTLALLDFQVLSTEAAPALHRAIRAAARRLRCETISCMTTRTLAARFRFLSAGLLKTPVVFKLIVHNLSKRFSDDFLLNEENWHVSWLDTDDI